MDYFIFTLIHVYFIGYFVHDDESACGDEVAIVPQPVSDGMNERDLEDDARRIARRARQITRSAHLAIDGDMALLRAPGEGDPDIWSVMVKVGVLYYLKESTNNRKTAGARSRCRVPDWPPMPHP